MTELMREEWVQVMHLLDAALDLPVTERAQWVETLPPERQPLKSALSRLLSERAAIETAEFLNALPPLSGGGPASAGLEAGRRIDAYRLVRELGHGGMASVWLAARADGAHQRDVALKLPYLGARARLIGERFTREREILSSLTHPHIASVLDAGTDQGQPWLAMEYVDGEAITTWAQRKELDVPDRLRLFLQVLQAVHFAHARLVIHRDLKPNNVLVDASGQVKLLDFGVAKLLGEAGATAETELTRLGGRALTPQYASPEQIAGEPLGTASDIYSLGVLLFELLTGQLPYIVKRATPAALEEAILAAQMAQPSALDLPKPVQRALRGDVDTIVLKALALRPEDRYSSAESLAQDIERHLRSLPILARPASFRYRVGKLIARNRLAFVAGAAVALAMIAGLAGALWQADIARQQTARAEAVQRFLVNTLSGADPENAQGEALSARELLDRSAARIDVEFAVQPDVQLALHETVTDLYYQLGETAKAREHADRLVHLLEATGQRDDKYLDALSMQCDLHVAESAEDSEPLARRAIELARQMHGEPNRWAGNLLADLAWVTNANGAPAEAMKIMETSLAMERAANGGHTSRFLGLMGTATTIALDSDLVRARTWAKEADRLSSAIAGVPTTDRLTARYNLARIELNSGDWVAAEALLRVLAPEVERHLGPLADLAQMSRSLWAQSLMLTARYDEALIQQRTAIANTQAREGVDELSVAVQQLTLARILHRAGKFPEGLRLAGETLTTMERLQPRPTLFRERLRFDLGLLLLSSGQVDAGRARLKEALDNFQEFAVYQRLPGRQGDQLAWLVATRQQDGSSEARARAASRAAAACTALRGMVPAESVLVPRCDGIQAWLAGNASGVRKARELLVARIPAGHPLLAELHAAEAEILMATDPGLAATLRAQADADFRKIFGNGIPQPLLTLH